jgi:hypothetical protein
MKGDTSIIFLIVVSPLFFLKSSNFVFNHAKLDQINIFFTPLSIFTIKSEFFQ